MGHNGGTREISSRYLEDRRETQATENQTDKTEGYDKETPNDTTYVMEDPRYNSALRVVTQALETLLNMNISIANMDHMENVVKIIISLCIDYNIKAENIQENMLAMGVYIRIPEDKTEGR